MLKLAIEPVVALILDDTMESLEYSNLVHTLDKQSIDVSLAYWADNKVFRVDFDTMVLFKWNFNSKQVGKIH